MKRLKKRLKKISKLIFCFVDFFKWEKVAKIFFRFVDFLKNNWKIILIIIGVILLCLFFYFFGKISDFFFFKENLEIEKDNTPKGELLKVFLTAIAGIVAVFVWHTSYKRVKVMEKQTEKTTEQIKVMYKGNIETRFNNAVKHLSNENSAIILAGMHVLQQIAVENEDYTKIVHNLFCSYLRENSAKLYEDIDFEKTPKYCPVIIQTLIDYLFKPYNNIDSVYKDFKSDLSFSTLKNCDFEKNDICNVIFRNCSFENCSFDFGNLTECDFKYATLTACFFMFSNLTECCFYYGTLTNCYFNQTTFKKCLFIYNNFDINSNTKFFKCYFYIKLIDTELPPNIENNCFEHIETKKSTKSKQKNNNI